MSVLVPLIKKLHSYSLTALGTVELERYSDVHVEVCPPRFIGIYKPPQDVGWVNKGNRCKTATRGDSCALAVFNNCVISLLILFSLWNSTLKILLRMLSFIYVTANIWPSWHMQKRDIMSVLLSGLSQASTQSLKRSILLLLEI